MELHSESFRSDQNLPPVYSCEGENCSPHLAWSGVPPGTRSLALVVQDPDAPSGVFGHWGLYDIPPDLTQLDEGFGSTNASTRGIKQVLNDFGHLAYDGPCPPHGHGVHHYQFQLMALDVPHLELPSRATCRELEEAARPHVLGKASLTGTYTR